MKNATYFGIGSCVLLMVCNFIPLAYYPDIQENFTGFYSRENTYGKPGIALIVLGTIAFILFLVPTLWAKRVNQVIAVLIFTYSLKTFILFTSTYGGGVHPQIKPGLIGILFFAFVILVSSLLSKAKTKESLT